MSKGAVVAAACVAVATALALAIWPAGNPANAAAYGTAAPPEPAAATPESRPAEPNHRPIRIAGDNNFPPFEYVAENGQYKGFNVDILRAVALEAGLDVEVVPLPWSAAVQALQEGRVDAIQGMKFTSDRARLYRFSDPYLTTSHAIFVRTGNQFIRQIEDLRGAHVAVQSDDFAAELLRALPGVRLVPVRDQEQALDRLAEGAVDAFVGNRLTGLYFVQKKRLAGQVQIVGEPISPADYGFAVARGNETLVALLNRGLAEIRRKGTYDKIYAKWFGERLDAPEPWLRPVAYGLAALAGAVLIGAVFVWRWNQALQREVRRRTGELDRAHRLSRMILASVPLGMISVDAGGTVLAANRQACELAGCGEAELVGVPVAATPLARFFDPADLARLGAADEAVAAREWQVPAGAEERTYRYGIHPLQAQGDRAGAVIVVADVTQEKRLAQRLFQQHKMESLGALVAGLAHEIRNPLTGLKTFAQLLPEKFDNPDFRAEATHHVPAEIERLDLLISELLDYARPRPPQPVAFPVAEAVTGALALLRGEAERARISLDVRIPADLEARADPRQIKQVLINVVLNSLQSTAAGGRVEIAARRESAAGVAPPMVAISVTDDGHGIARADLDRIFDPFFTRRRDGSGLGLYMSYQYVRENGGDIQVDSREGAGTRVLLRLPAA